MPIASTVTPGTISVQSAISITSRYKAVPYLDFTSLDFTECMPFSGQTADGTGVMFQYMGPSAHLTTISIPVLQQGSTLAITLPHVNASWNIAFSGPFLRCSQWVQCNSTAADSQFDCRIHSSRGRRFRDLLFRATLLELLPRATFLNRWQNHPETFWRHMDRSHAWPGFGRWLNDL